jgi:hypothetical protein
VPWRLGDLFLLYACTAVGLLIIGIAWFGASSSVDVDTQVRWTNLGVGGLIILGAGVLAWLLAGRRAIGELRRHVTPLIPVPIHEAGDVTSDGAKPDPDANDLVSGPGMTHYHRRHCVFVAGKAVKKGTERSFHRQKRKPCGACLAERAAEGAS